MRDHSIWFTKPERWHQEVADFIRRCEEISMEFEWACTNPRGLEGCIYFMNAKERADFFDAWMKSHLRSEWKVSYNRIFDFILDVRFKNGHP